ncbi:TPA: hypothetical protein U2T46_000874 [Burkholderia cenocepacia]|nr:hypothetical protein [Burkholderia cenocepacia]
MNCRPGDVAYFSRNMPPADWNDMQSVLVRGTFGHVVEVIDVAQRWPVVVWHVRPMVIVVRDGNMTRGGTLTLACDEHLVPIAGLSRTAELLGVDGYGA